VRISKVTPVRNLVFLLTRKKRWTSRVEWRVHVNAERGWICQLDERRPARVFIIPDGKLVIELTTDHTRRRGATGVDTALLGRLLLISACGHSEHRSRDRSRVFTRWSLLAEFWNSTSSHPIFSVWAMAFVWRLRVNTEHYQIQNCSVRVSNHVEFEFRVRVRVSSNFLPLTSTKTVELPN